MKYKREGKTIKIMSAETQLDSDSIVIPHSFKLEPAVKLEEDVSHYK